MNTIMGRLHQYRNAMISAGVLNHDNRTVGNFRPALVITPVEKIELLHGLDMRDIFFEMGEISCMGILIFIRPENHR